MRDFVKQHISETKNKKFECKRCKARFVTKKELEEHKRYLHSEYPKSYHNKVKASTEHSIYNKHYGKNKRKKQSKPFNPKKVYNSVKNLIIQEPKFVDVDIPVKNRIYPPSAYKILSFNGNIEDYKEEIGKHHYEIEREILKNDVVVSRLKILIHPEKPYTSKVSKETADRLFQVIERTKSSKRTRPEILVYVDRMLFKDDKKRVKQPIEVMYIWDENQSEYRIYTNDTIYGDFVELIFDNSKQRYVMKNVKSLKPELKEEKVDEMLQV